MLANLDDPDALIPGLCVAVLSLVYGFFAKFIVDAFAVDPAEPAAQSSKTPVTGGMWILGIIILVFINAFTMNWGGSITLFFDLPSFLIVFVGGFGALFISTCPETLALGLRAGLGKLYNSKDDAVKAVRICCGMYNRFMTFGFIGAVIGLYYMFLNLNDPDRLGPGMAMALISLFYALILGSISIGFMTAARRQVNMFGDDEKPEYVISPVAAGLASFLLVMASFATLLASF
ncbi:MAG: hypothetical protein GY863_23985 [bacterium]|nr:hypothetical protein [bacterium]